MVILYSDMDSVESGPKPPHPDNCTCLTGSTDFRMCALIVGQVFRLDTSNSNTGTTWTMWTGNVV